MVEEKVRGAASGGMTPDADIISAWQSDFDSFKQSVGVATKVELTLPTGNKVKAVRIPLLLLLQQGAIPDALTQIVSTFISGIQGGDSQKAAAVFEASFAEGGDAVGAALKWIDLINFVCVNCIVTPRFVLKQEEADPPNGVFWIASMNFYDKQWLFSWAQGVDQSVREFLQQQADALGTALDGEGVRLTTEQLLAHGRASEFMVRVADQPSSMAMGSIYSEQDRRDRPSANPEGEETSNAERAQVSTGANLGDAGGRD